MTRHKALLGFTPSWTRLSKQCCRYIAYGNARNGSKGLECQHGPQECMENKALLCAIDSASGQDEWCALRSRPRTAAPCCIARVHLLWRRRFPFALCLSQNHKRGAIELCADTAKLDYAAIKDCMTGASLARHLCRSAE